MGCWARRAACVTKRPCCVMCLGGPARGGQAHVHPACAHPCRCCSDMWSRTAAGPTRRLQRLRCAVLWRPIWDFLVVRSVDWPVRACRMHRVSRLERGCPPYPHRIASKSYWRAPLLSPISISILPPSSATRPTTSFLSAVTLRSLVLPNLSHVVVLAPSTASAQPSLLRKEAVGRTMMVRAPLPPSMSHPPLAPADRRLPPWFPLICAAGPSSSGLHIM